MGAYKRSMQETAISASSSVTNKKRGIKLSDILLVIVFVVIVVALLVVLMKQLGLRHEVNDAKLTTDKLITAIREQDGEAARLLGDPTFRARNNPDQLKVLFAQSKPYISGKSTVTKQTVNNGKANRVISIYYKFDNAKPFYVRVTAIEPNTAHRWSIINFSGNASLNALTQ